MEHYDVKELGLLMQSLTSKIDQFMRDNHEEHCQMRGTLENHNGRLRKVEVWRAYITGAMAVIIFGMTVLFVPLIIKSFTVTTVSAEVK